MFGDIRDNKTKSFYRLKRVAEGYEKDRFRSKAGRLTDRLHQEAVVSLLNKGGVVGKKILDLGCGTGRFSRLFSSMGGRVVSVDVSREMLLQARKQRSAEVYVEGTILSLPFKENAFDLTVSINVLNHLFSYEQAIGEICRVSKKIILGLPNKHSLLLLAYPYRILKGWGTEYSRFTAKKYEIDSGPYSRYFSLSELKPIFEKNGFGNIQRRGCWISNILPNGAVPILDWINKVPFPLFKNFGTFFAVAAEKQ